MRTVRVFLVLAMLLLQLTFVFHPADADGRERAGGMGRHSYGGYCTGRDWGWYGAGKPVDSPEKARGLLQEYYRGFPVVIGEITEHRGFFEAVILDRQGEVLDEVIVHKRNGRIRSIR